MKTIIFRHRTGFRSDDYYEEEVEFDDDATDDEIGEYYVDWVFEQVGDNFTWYEKE